MNCLFICLDLFFFFFALFNFFHTNNPEAQIFHKVIQTFVTYYASFHNLLLCTQAQGVKVYEKEYLLELFFKQENTRSVVDICPSLFP